MSIPARGQGAAGGPSGAFEGLARRLGLGLGLSSGLGGFGGADDSQGPAGPGHGEGPQHEVLHGAGQSLHLAILLAAGWRQVQVCIWIGVQIQGGWGAGLQLLLGVTVGALALRQGQQALC